MARFVAKVKKWGNSLGVVIPAESVRNLRLRTGDEVEMTVRRKPVRAGELYGIFKDEMKDWDWAEVRRELKRGWRD